MRSLRLRILLLAFSLPLVLPVGWCCMVATAFTQADDPRQQSPPPTCSCCPSHVPHAPAKPKPRQLPPEKCPCLWEAAKAPDSPTPPHPDAAISVEAVPADPARALPGFPRSVRLDLPPPEPHLHLLLCVWLC
jgi:hypothetical protein